MDRWGGGGSLVLLYMICRGFVKEANLSGIDKKKEESMEVKGVGRMEGEFADRGVMLTKYISFFLTGRYDSSFVAHCLVGGICIWGAIQGFDEAP